MEAAITKVKSGWESAKERKEDYKLMGGKGEKLVLATIKQDDTEKNVIIAAMKSVARGEFAISVAKQVWDTMEPAVEQKKPTEELEKLPPLPCFNADSIWNKMKGKIQAKVEKMVETKVSEGVDKAIAAKQ